MKRSQGNAGKTLERLLARRANPSPERMESAINRVRERLRSGVDDAPAEDISNSDSIQRVLGFRKIALATAAAAFAILSLLSVPFVRTFVSPENGYAIVETVDGSLYSIAGGKSHAVKTGDRLDRGKILHTNGGAGAMLALADGSRVEMRSQSELALQTAEDGALLQLNGGSIIVTAAKQNNGHLYVRTRDVTVSVVGTVFLVNAETEGSRVAVIQGEVQVQQGATLKNLLPGEQVATNPIMQSVPVIEEILWSRNAAAHLALLQQALLVSTAIAPQNSVTTAQTPTEERVAFDVASIKRSGPSPAGGRGGGPALAPAGVAMECTGDFSFQLNPGRFVTANITLYALIALAYGNRCPAPDMISGGLDWVHSDKFEIQAIIPEGTSSYTREQLLGGNAPKLQRMLQTLLSDRFKLVLHREVKEMPAYNLVVVKDGKLTLSKDQSPEAANRGSLMCGVCVRWNRDGVFTYENPSSPSTSISRFAIELQGVVGRPIIDKTGLKGLYDVRLEFPELGGPMSKPPNADPAPNFLNWSLTEMRDRVPAKLQEQLGLKLEPTRAPVEILVIESAEKPAEN